MENEIIETEEYVRPDKVKVSGPLKCSAHSDAKSFVFVYSTNTYHHVHKNGGICSSPVIIKRRTSR
jgi:hypothetical protein